MGILTIVPDYRNFPQGDVEDMVTDVIAAVSWTSKNAESYGGDKAQVPQLIPNALSFSKSVGITIN
jgi:acetyl esterase/lipase